MTRTDIRHSRSLLPAGEPLPSAESMGDADAIQRVDSAHPSTTEGSLSANEPPASNDSDADEGALAARESLLTLHAADLIERLQAWSLDLDARESQINSRAALQEHRERQFRLWAQSKRADLEEQVRAAEQRAEESRQVARRLAIAEIGQGVR